VSFLLLLRVGRTRWFDGETDGEDEDDEEEEYPYS
jgi:hypothetical protein